MTKKQRLELTWTLVAGSTHWRRVKAGSRTDVYETFKRMLARGVVSTGRRQSTAGRRSRSRLPSTLLVVTTHSPELLDASWITDDNLRIVSWQEGASHLLLPSAATREAMRGHLMGAGELLRSNALHPEDLFANDETLRTGSLFESLA